MIDDYTCNGFDIDKDIDDLLSDFLVEKEASKTVSLTSSGFRGWQDDFKETMKAIADGVCEPKVYLLSVDPGFGKTTAAIDYIKKAKADGFRDGSILILVSRLDEVQAYVDGSGLSDKDYAVLVAKPPLRDLGLGYENAGVAPVLFTTQQMLSSRMGTGPFEDIEEYLYKGRLRPIRIWDESILPAEPVSVNLDDVRSLPAALRSIAPKFITALDAWLDSIAGFSSSVSYIPGAIGNLIDAEVTKPVSDSLSSKHQQALIGLRSLAGREVELFNDGNYGPWIVGCTRRLPEDIMPLVVLDASGSVRGTYDVWSRYSDDLVRITAERPSYRNMKILVHKIASGKAASRKPAEKEKIAEIAAEVIGADDEKWLVIGHKDDSADSIFEQIKSIVPNQDRLSFVHWGDHHGTNIHRHIKRVFVLGLQTYPNAAYRAMHRAVSGSTGSFNTAECKEIKSDEYKHHLLQGILRCNARNHEHGVCGDAVVYVIAAPGVKPIELLRSTFPGALVGEWHPKAAPLKGNALKLILAIERALDASDGKPVQKREIAASTSISQTAIAKLLRQMDVTTVLLDKGITVRAREYRLS